MKSNKKEEPIIDMSEVEAVAKTSPKPKVQAQNKQEKAVERRTNSYEDSEDLELINPLKKVVVTVKHLDQPGTISDPKHVLSGGMAETATCTISVPRLRSGVFVDVLTKSEKKYLENVMGLEEGAMNVYNRTNNFWDNNTQGGISKVRLTKFDTKLKLDVPEDYIKYKILLANKNLICPNLETLQDRPKATYKFVLISDSEVTGNMTAKISTKRKCWTEFNKYINNFDILKTVIELITGKPIALNTKIEFLQTKAGELIDSDSRIFLKVITDPLLPTKILIKKAIDQGFISKRGDYLYLREDNTPLCEGGQEPTMSVAAAYLSNPKRQDIKLSLEAKVNS